ncbi:hypothetical protein JOE48_001328 [Methylobacterium sp. PvR107]|nr:hypothetical protein [Methylobacterium sp. PvR107]
MDRESAIGAAARAKGDRAEALFADLARCGRTDPGFTRASEWRRRRRPSRRLCRRPCTSVAGDARKGRQQIERDEILLQDAAQGRGGLRADSGWRRDRAGREGAGFL